MNYYIFSGFNYSPQNIKNEDKFIWIANNNDSEIISTYFLEKISSNSNNKIFVEKSINHIVKNEKKNSFSFNESKKFAKLDKKISSKETTGKIRGVFYAQSDTLSHSIYKIIRNNNTIQAKIFTPIISKEKAADFFLKNNIASEKYNFWKLAKFKPHFLLFLNDWSKEAQRIIAHCHLLKIPVICLQESIIDFGDNFKRMKWSDYVFVQGARTVLDLDRVIYFITGNPRYELEESSSNNSVKKKVLINCNFTYNVFEEIRETWLNDIVHILEENKISYEITQHPRDTGDLSKYKNVASSSSSIVANQIKESKLLITRFSSLIHEALVQHVPVIYYNPHKEVLKYDFEFNTEFLQLATNKVELSACISKILSSGDYSNEIDKYLVKHCLPSYELPSTIILNLLDKFYFKPIQFSLRDLKSLFLYLPLFRYLYDKVKLLFNI